MVTGFSLFMPIGDGNGACVQANDPLGIATAVPITGPGGCEYEFNHIKRKKSIVNARFIMMCLL